MRTRNIDNPGSYGFEYRDPGRYYKPWSSVGGQVAPRTWSTTAERDAARACFTQRRSVGAAMSDLKALDARASQSKVVL